MIHTIDAKGKKLGRIATQAAVFLMGKDTPAYRRNEEPNVKVHIINTSKAALTEKKQDEKLYRRYSGYPGGLKTKSLKQVTHKKGFKQIFEDAIYGMLPTNKLRPRMMKNLIITE